MEAKGFEFIGVGDLRQKENLRGSGGIEEVSYCKMRKIDDGGSAAEVGVKKFQKRAIVTVWG